MHDPLEILSGTTSPARYWSDAPGVTDFWKSWLEHDPKNHTLGLKPLDLTQATTPEQNALRTRS
jgi:hypothetical protein